MERFLTCARTCQKAQTRGQVQQRSLEFVLAAYQSIEAGIPVTRSRTGKYRSRAGNMSDKPALQSRGR